MYLSAYLIGYYGLFRVGELAQSQHVIKATSIHESRKGNKLLIILYSSKTHGRESLPQKIQITGQNHIQVFDDHHWVNRDHGTNLACNDTFCPVKWTRRYIKMRRKIRQPEKQLYIFSDSSPVTPMHLRNLLRETLNNLNLDSNLYDTHSLRIGRATDLFKHNVDIETIKQLGRWKSNAVYRYLRN